MNYDDPYIASAGVNFNEFNKENTQDVLNLMTNNNNNNIPPRSDLKSQ